MLRPTISETCTSFRTLVRKPLSHDQFNDAEKSQSRVLLWLLSAIALPIHLLTNPRYGYFRDELYFIACARHLDWGYVDLAPLSALILRIELTLFGESLFALRLFPPSPAPAPLPLTGALARQMGGRTWSVALACLASLSAPVYLGIGNFYSLNVFEPLFWMGCVYCLVRIINGGAAGYRLSALGCSPGSESRTNIRWPSSGAGLVLALPFHACNDELLRPGIWLGGVIALCARPA